ncbi:MAG: fibronectin type III domain-containing protein [Limnochordia bacterium]|jgi:hypothetical protein
MSTSPLLRAGQLPKSRWRSLVWRAATVVAIAALAGGCSLLPMRSVNRLSNVQEDSQASGRLMIAANLSSIPDLSPDASAVTLIVSKDGRQRTQQVPVVDSQASATVGDLLPGVWHVALRVCDDTDEAVYEAEGDVSILPNNTATLELVLRPLPGYLTVTVNPEAHPQLHAAQKGRLYINPGGYTSMTEEPDGTLTATKMLPAGTYDYSIALYSNSFYAKDRIYESHWDTVSILPGRTTSLQWDPVTGECVVIGNIDNPPPAPTNVELAITGDGLHISWPEVPDAEGDLEGYRIYLRQDPLDKFGLVHEVDAGTRLYTHPTKQLGAGRVLEVVVTAVDQGGQESNRSEVVSIVYIAS